MKRLKKIFNIILLAALMFAQLPVVFAGSAAVNINVNNTSITVGSNVEFTVRLDNIVDAVDGIAGFQGWVEYDSDYLEYSKAQVLAPFTVSYSDKTKMISGIALDPDTRLTASSGNLIKVIFKTKKTGTTTFKLKRTEVSAGNNAKLTSTTPSKEITIVEPAPKSTNANLSSIAVGTYTLTPAFDKNTTEYRVTVPYSVSSVTITSTPEDSKATVQRTLNVSNLAPDKDNAYTITCTAEDGTTKKAYKVIIHREKQPEVPKSSDNNLKSLGVSGFTISPAFNKDTTDYSLTVPFETDKVKVNYEANDGKATVEVKGGDNLQVGDNKVEVIVKAEDGSTKVYNINVKKEEKKEEPKKDDDATLKSLSIGNEKLTPEFSKENNVYSINVGENVTGLKVNAITNSDKAKVEVKGSSGWKYGMNTVTVVVTAENGNKNTYIINVNRKSPAGTPTPNKSSDSYLSSLVVNGASINPNFDKDVSSYTVLVPYDTEKLDVSFVKSNNKAKVEILNNDELKVGTNNVQVKVTAEDGSVRVYTINATRAAFSAKNNLKVLSAGGFTLNPNFDKDRLEYNLKVKSNTESLDLTAIAEDEKAKVEITGNGNFKEGNNVVLIKVTDENGFTKYYQINVDKPAASVMGMSWGSFFMNLLLWLGLLGVLILLIILLKRRKDREPKKQVVSQPTPPTPVIDFKPEFNFGSRNGTDDDVVYPGGVLNQGNGQLPNTEPKKLMEADYHDLTDEDIEEVTRSFDFLDQTITRRYGNT